MPVETTTSTWFMSISRMALSVITFMIPWRKVFKYIMLVFLYFITESFQPNLHITYPQKVDDDTFEENCVCGCFFC